MADDEHETLTVTVDVRKLDEHGPISNWDESTRLSVSFSEKDKAVLIIGNREALNSLARHLLTLTQPGTTSGYNMFWEAESGWFETDETGLHIMLAE